MSIKIEIFADNNSALAGDLEYLASLVQPLAAAQDGPPDVTLNLRQTLKGAPLDVVREIVNEIFDAQGFEVVIKDRQEAAPADQGGPPEAEPTEAPKTPRKRGGRPPLVDAKTAAEKLKGNGADAAEAKKAAFDALYGEESEPEAVPEPAPEADRDFVLEGLGKIIADPKRKAQAMTFAARMAKENGTDKLTKLGAEKFPAIRIEMEKEFPSGG